MSGGQEARQSLGVIEPLLAELDHATAELAARAGQMPESPAAKPSAAGPQRRSLAARLAEVARLAVHAHWALCDPPVAIRLLPGLEPSALEADRYRGQIEPWISLQALDQGPAELRRYPPEGLAAVRQAYRAMLAAYRDRQSAGGPAHCSAAIERFAAVLEGSWPSRSSPSGGTFRWSNATRPSWPPPPIRPPARPMPRCNTTGWIPFFGVGS